jgi:DNA-binding NarL/FixJ family response regulator
LARIEASRIAIVVVSAELMECSKMNACTSPSPRDLSRVQTISRSNVGNDGAFLADTASLVDLPATRQFSEKRVRVYVAAHNRLLREALARILTKRGNVEVTGLDSPLACEAATLVRQGADVLLLVSLGAVQEDLVTIQRLHANAPGVRILLIGSTNEDGEFLQCVRAGISGYLWRDASPDHVLDGIRAVHAGEAVCPGALCTTLFRYFERETPELPCASPRQRLGLTRREQQLVPLIAKGFTNKEIANHFCLSEQTVKNHLYRMKHKIGAEDRLNIVQRFRTQGFLL